MSRPFKIVITESEEELKKRLQAARVGSQKEKLLLLWWLKSGQDRCAAGNWLGLGQRYFNGDEVVTEIPKRWTLKSIGNQEGTRSNPKNE